MIGRPHIVGLMMTLVAVTVSFPATAGHPEVPDGYRAAAREARVAPVLLYAIALVESGQSGMTAAHRPWPWTLSLDGEAHYFGTREEAQSALEEAVRRGVGQIGVGLFQVEHRFHSHRFRTDGEMLDPYANSLAAADILSENLEETGGDVLGAVGHFHSRTPDLADAYRDRVARRLFQLLGSGG